MTAAELDLVRGAAGDCQAFDVVTALEVLNQQFEDMVHGQVPVSPARRARYHRRRLVQRIIMDATQHAYVRVLEGP